METVSDGGSQTTPPSLTRAPAALNPPPLSGLDLLRLASACEDPSFSPAGSISGVFNRYASSDLFAGGGLAPPLSSEPDSEGEDEEQGTNHNIVFGSTTTSFPWMPPPAPPSPAQHRRLLSHLNELVGARTQKKNIITVCTNLFLNLRYF